MKTHTLTVINPAHPFDGLSEQESGVFGKGDTLRALNEIVTDFFHTHGTVASRKTLWTLFSTGLKGNFHQLEPLEMAQLASFYESLDELLTELAIRANEELPN